MRKCSFRRARQPEQKQQRIDALLGAAGELVDEQGAMGVSVGAIAKRAGLSKGNLYRYFESREAILLELLHQAWAEWVAALEQRLLPLGASDDAAAVAQALARSAAQRPRMCELTGVLSAVLEQNLSVEAVVRFKTRGLGVFIRAVNALHAALPGLGLEGARRFLTTYNALIAGLWPLANPPPAVQEALQRPELQAFQHDFASQLEEATRALLLGLQAEAP